MLSTRIHRLAAMAMASVLAGGIGSAAAAGLAATAGPKMTAAAAQAVEQQIKKDGSTRVFVELAADNEPLAQLPAGALKNAEKNRLHREAISRLQDRVLLSMPAARGVKQFRNLPALAMEVSETELQELLRQDVVASIREDVLLDPHLNVSGPQIGADTVWALGYTGVGQTVAILDTGVDYTHPVFAGKVVDGACFSTNGSSSESLCPNGSQQQYGVDAAVACDFGNVCHHGTHVAGIAGGDDASYNGVAPGADIISIQVFSLLNGNSVRTYYSDVVRGLDWLYDQRGSYTIASANLSLGGGSYADSCDTAYGAFTNIVQTLRGAGIATVASSGNSRYSAAIGFPACISDIISVGSVSSADRVDNYSNSAAQLDVLAPGSGIRSAIPGGGLASKSGTSMAAPHVAGALAVLKSAAPAASVDQLMTALASTGVTVVDSRNGIAKPRIQVDAALTALAGDITPPPDPDPEPDPAPDPDPVPDPDPAPDPDPDTSGDDIPLQLGQVDTTQYGNRWGTEEYTAEVRFTFTATGADLLFTLRGYDIDNPREVNVFLNGVKIGNLSKGPNNALSAGDQFLLESTSQSAGTNVITLQNINANYKWGVTDVLLAGAGDEGEPDPEPDPDPQPDPGPDPEPGQIALVVGVLDTGEYGNRWGSDEHQSELSAVYTHNGTALFLDVSGYSINNTKEVTVYLNGTKLGNLSVGSKSGMNGGDRFELPANLQQNGVNTLLFVHNNGRYRWGVTDLLLTSP